MAVLFAALFATAALANLSVAAVSGSTGALIGGLANCLGAFCCFAAGVVS